MTMGNTDQRRARDRLADDGGIVVRRSTTGGPRACSARTAGDGRKTASARRRGQRARALMTAVPFRRGR